MSDVKTIQYTETFEFFRTEIETRDSLNTLNLRGFWEVVWRDLEGNEIKREKNLNNPLTLSIVDIDDPAVLSGFLAVTNFMKDKLIVHLNPPEPEVIEE
jgi:hypothetical protein